MSAKEVKFEVDARDKMLRGADIIGNAVRVRVGHRGRNVVLDSRMARLESPKTADVVHDAGQKSGEFV